MQGVGVVLWRAGRLCDLQAPLTGAALSQPAMLTSGSSQASQLAPPTIQLSSSPLAYQKGQAGCSTVSTEKDEVE